MSTETNNCPKCGAPLPSDAPKGLCPECLLRGGLENTGAIQIIPAADDPRQRTIHIVVPADEPAGGVPETIRYFGDYELVERIAEGGMGVDCWNLCNRKNTVWRQFTIGDAVVNELAYPVNGAHGLLIPKRHLARMLGHWDDVSDLAMFAALHRPGWKMWQVVRPVLVEHVGVVSTFDESQTPQPLEVNHAA